MPNLGCRGQSHLGTFHQKTAWNVLHEWAHCQDEAANHQLPIAAAIWIIQIVSTEEHSSLTQNLMQISCSALLVVLHVMATQYPCSFKGIYHPHWLVQWSRYCSHMHIPDHSPWLPGYVMQTILVMLAMAGLLPDRPHIHIFIFNGTYKYVKVYLHLSSVFGLSISQ